MITGTDACTQRIDQMADQPTDDDQTPAGIAPAPDASRPSRAKRHLRLVPDTEAPDTEITKGKGGDVRKRATRSAPDAQTGLTAKQSMFCDGISSGMSLSDAYRAAYDTSGMQQKQVWEEASKLAVNPKVAQRLKEISQEKADQLRMLAASDAAAAVEVFRKMMLAADTDASKIRAAELLAKASGVFTDKVEVTDKTDRSTAQIEQEIADRLRRLGIAG